jgi:hypothetical protein
MSQEPTVKDSQVTTEDIQEIKNDVNDDFDDKVYKGAKTPWIMFGIMIAFLVVFVIVVAVFFYIGYTPIMYQISIVNNKSSDTIICYLNNIVRISLPPQTVKTIYATPACSIQVSGWLESNPPPDDLFKSKKTPFTKVNLLLNERDFEGTPFLIIDNIKITTHPSGLDRIDDLNDVYNVSIQDGYNLPITIRSSSPGITGVCNGFPSWTNVLNTKCPDGLKYPNSENQIACMSPCFAYGYTGGTGDSNTYCCTDPGSCSPIDTCKINWGENYILFLNECLQCNITNCKETFQTCGNTNPSIYNNYIITFL